MCVCVCAIYSICLGYAGCWVAGCNQINARPVFSFLLHCRCPFVGHKVQPIKSYLFSPSLLFTFHLFFFLLLLFLPPLLLFLPPLLFLLFSTTQRPDTYLLKGHPNTDTTATRLNKQPPTTNNTSPHKSNQTHIHTHTHNVLTSQTNRN